MAKNLILPIIGVLLVLLVAVITVLYFIKKNKQIKQEMTEEEKNLITAQDFTNILDIKNDILFSADGNIFSYVNIESIALDLMTEKEKKVISEKMTLALSAYKNPWKLVAISRNIDTQPLIEDYQEMYNNTDSILRKKLLSNSVHMMENYSQSGSVIQRQFYFVLWKKYKDKSTIDEFNKEKQLFISELQNAGIKSTLLEKAEIIRILNIYNNPHVLPYEDYSNEEDSNNILFMKKES